MKDEKFIYVEYYYRYCDYYIAGFNRSIEKRIASNEYYQGIIKFVYDKILKSYVYYSSIKEPDFINHQEFSKNYLLDSNFNTLIAFENIRNYSTEHAPFDPEWVESRHVFQIRQISSKPIVYKTDRLFNPDNCDISDRMRIYRHCEKQKENLLYLLAYIKTYAENLERIKIDSINSDAYSFKNLLNTTDSVNKNIRGEKVKPKEYTIFPIYHVEPIFADLSKFDKEMYEGILKELSKS